MVEMRQATQFMVTHARLLDRRRFAHLLGTGSASALLDAVEAYRNADAGYGSGLEPDLRSIESQPAGALHAFEIFDEVGPHPSPRAAELCDWLGGVSSSD